MKEKTAKEIGENIILNPRMIIWSYYEPYQIVLKKIDEYDNVAQILDEIHAKVIGTIAFAYFNKLLNSKEVLILCNRIDISGEIFLTLDINAIAENTDYLLQLYKNLDTVVLTTSQTQTVEDFKEILKNNKNGKKTRKLKKYLKKMPEEKLWKAYWDYINCYMDLFKKNFVLPEEQDIRFKINPYSALINDFEKTQKIDLNKVLKDLITSVLSMPIEAESYYQFQEEYVIAQCHKTLCQNDIQSPEYYEEKAILYHIYKTLKNAAGKKKINLNVNLDDTAIIEYIADNLSDEKVTPLIEHQTLLGASYF